MSETEPEALEVTNRIRRAEREEAYDSARSALIEDLSGRLQYSAKRVGSERGTILLTRDRVEWALRFEDGSWHYCSARAQNFTLEGHIPGEIECSEPLVVSPAMKVLGGRSTAFTWFHVDEIGGKYDIVGCETYNREPSDADGVRGHLLEHLRIGGTYRGFHVDTEFNHGTIWDVVAEFRGCAKQLISAFDAEYAMHGALHAPAAEPPAVPPAEVADGGRLMVVPGAPRVDH